jgi:hypothetical protein
MVNGGERHFGHPFLRNMSGNCRRIAPIIRIGRT